jgi:7-keto-8-aminopelargonate synthetase-like enzyme
MIAREQRLHRLLSVIQFKSCVFVEEEGFVVVTSKAAATVAAVIPLIMKAGVTTVLFARWLSDQGIVAAPLLFPALPQDSARIRLCVAAAQETGD